MTEEEIVEVLAEAFCAEEFDWANRTAEDREPVLEVARSCYDAVAPLIAARALRDASRAVAAKGGVEPSIPPWWLRDRADAIEERRVT